MPVRKPLRVADYLVAVRRICCGGEVRATTGAVAAALDVSNGTASVVLKRLAEQGLLDHVPYEGVRLTSEGEQMAEESARRLALLRRFLEQTLNGRCGLEVDRESVKLELAASDALIDAIGDFLSSH